MTISLYFAFISIFWVHFTNGALGGGGWGVSPSRKLSHLLRVYPERFSSVLGSVHSVSDFRFRRV
jgi:hypothetical protein